MPSSTTIRRIDCRVFGLLTLDKGVVDWYCVAERDCDVVVGVFWEYATAVAVAFAFGPPLVWWLVGHLRAGICQRARA